MKIVKEKKDKRQRTVTLRISEATMQKVDDIAEKNEISRQKLIESILEQVIRDKKFILKIEE